MSHCTMSLESNTRSGFLTSMLSSLASTPTAGSSGSNTPDGDNVKHKFVTASAYSAPAPIVHQTITQELSMLTLSDAKP
eukprot:8188-Pyramimonas_sp.AAC.1